MKYKLELTDDSTGFDGWAFVHFHSSTPGYLLADSLNGLYSYHLARIDDMPLGDDMWPLYRYEDNVRHLVFFLVDRPASFFANDKLLIIKGKTATDEARHIQTDFATPPDCEDGDLLGQEHADILEMLLADFTVATMLDLDTTPMSRTAAKEHATMQQLCNNILTYIEQSHLDLTKEELLLMEQQAAKNRRDE